MNSQDLNLNTKRARLARASVLLGSRAVRLVLTIIAAVGLIGWAILFFVLHSAAAYLALSLITALLPVAWYKGALRTLPVAGDAQSAPLDAILEQAILGRIKKEVTLKQLLGIIAKMRGGIFFANRYAISKSSLEILHAEDTEITIVWQKARELAATHANGAIDSAVLTAAIILTVPESDFFLAQLQLDSEAIIMGLDWYAHIQHILETIEVKKHTGGIGRDLSFGWAPLLNRIGINISEGVRGGMLHRQIEGHEESMQQMMHLLAQSGRRNVTLVGEVGVGKTTLVYALAQRLMTNPKSVDSQLRYRQIIELDAAQLISQASGRGELEGLLAAIVGEALHAKNIILFLDEAHLFLQDGTGSVDLSRILLPVLEGGALQIILAIDDQEWLRLSQTNPGLAQLMNRVVVSPLDHEDTLRVMEDQILLLESRNPVVYMHQSLNEAYKLADRFIHEQAFPGKAIRLLESAAGFAEQEHFITSTSVQKAVEKTFDVKVQTASSSQERDTLLNLEGKIHERMINQSRAVQVVSDALRRARAGVRNQNKPIGTFLFLGPTGVGKTELSKALAVVYFGGEDRLIRVDLNEYSQSNSVSRLLETGAQNSASLTAQIAKQPFSVVLLDEIEKAHPDVLNVLLQMLDEGVLLDAQNKPVSFRDAIIIATSNAGADKIRAHIEAGEQLEQFEDQFIDELINTNIFRPEFLNRFDETVLFRPLTVEELKQVVDLIVASINKTLAAQKVSVSLTDAAKQLLAEKGYDPRLGARPLRRVTQRSIENIVAQKLLSNQAIPGTTIELDAPELEAALTQRS